MIEKNTKPLKNQYEEVIKKSSYHKLCEREAWRCLLCNTINGMQGHKKLIRTLCSKCKRIRGNPLTFKQELELPENILHKAVKIAKLVNISLDKAVELIKELAA